MHRSATLSALVAVVALPAIAGLTSPATAPSTRPSLIPPEDAPTLGTQLGRITALTVRYDHGNGDEVEYWDAVLTDRTVLERVEAMRRSDWRGGDLLLYVRSYDATARIGDLKFTGGMGRIKLAAHRYGMHLRAADGRSGLFVETGEAAKELDRLITAEALRQRPKYPMSEQRR